MKETYYGFASEFIFEASYEKIMDALGLKAVSNKEILNEKNVEIEFTDGNVISVEVLGERIHAVDCSCNNPVCKHTLYAFSKLHNLPLITGYRAKEDSSFLRLCDMYLILDSCHDENIFYCPNGYGNTSDFSEAGIFSLNEVKGFPIIHSAMEISNYEECAISLLDFVKNLVDLNVDAILKRRNKRMRKS